MNDLVKRLRKSKAIWSTSALGSLADEAADRIAYLESDDAIVDMTKKLLDQKARIVELEGLLTRVLVGEGAYLPTSLLQNIRTAIKELEGK